MASNPPQKANWLEYVASGWWNGQNAARSAWLLPDTQYQTSVNTVNRGGIPQTRPGKRLRLTLPSGNLQGTKIFRATKSDATVEGYSIVFAVDGKVYYAPFPLSQPASWEPFRLKNIQFAASAKNIYWAIGEKTLQSNDVGELDIVPTYTVLVMQDGESDAAYWDGLTNAHLDENARQTPRGTWMAWAGNKLWVMRGNSVIAGDDSDPLSFVDRTTGPSAGDFSLDDEGTGLTAVPGDNRNTNLLAFTNKSTTSFLASLTDRDAWSTTPNFQTILYAGLGCVAGRSIISHAGLIWWYAPGGLVSSNSVAASFLTSEIKYRDTEMVNSKRNLAPDLSGVCSASFENYFLVSVPSGDVLNAHTWCLDSAQATDTLREEPAAWNSVWVGTRPVEWATEIIDGRKRIFEASIDYQSLADGSFNHIWENFDPSRTDSYVLTDASNTQILVQNPIFCSWESKLFGDGMDFKRLRYAEADLVEIGEGNVNLKISYCGNRGTYKEILTKKINATTSAANINNDDVQLLGERLGSFHVQSRRVRTEDAKDMYPCENDVESDFNPDLDKSHSLLFQWCGRMGIEALRMYHEFVPEKMIGKCEEDENGINIVTDEGVSFKFDTENSEGQVTNDFLDATGVFSDSAWVAPVTPRFKDVFYSAIPVSWSDLEGECVVCLPCSRDTFAPPASNPITIQGKTVL